MKHHITASTILLALLALLFAAAGASAEESQLGVDPVGVNALDAAFDTTAELEESADTADEACSEESAGASDFGLPGSPMALLSMQRNELTGGSCEMCTSRSYCVAYCGSTAVACVTDPSCGDWRYCFCF